MERQEESLKALIGIMRTHTHLVEFIKNDIAQYSLNMTEFSVLELLYHRGPQPIQKIGQRILIASSSTTYVIDQLVAKDYVYRRRSTKDRRIFYADLTSRGSRLIAQIFPQHAQRVAEFFEPLALEDLHQLRESLKLLIPSDDEVVSERVDEE